MANDTLNQKESIEKSIDEYFTEIDLGIIRLKDKINELCKLLMEYGIQEEKVCTITAGLMDLSRLQQQLHYYAEIIKDEKLQRQNKPLIIGD